MKIESLQPAMAELERALQWASKPTGINGNHVVPTLQTRGRKVTCTGWFDVNRWSTREGQLCHEINFSAETLNRDPIDIIATAVHETVHLWCHSLKLKDVSSGGRHNKIFKEYAELLGLLVEKPHDSRGYAYTSPGEELAKRIESEFQPDIAAFNLFRLVDVPKEKAPTKMKKWMCGCTTIRCATKVVAGCDECGEKFEIQ